MLLLSNFLLIPLKFFFLGGQSFGLVDLICVLKLHGIFFTILKFTKFKLSRITIWNEFLLIYLNSFKS
ncbi:hypothetical protein BpHYR1_013734 [Brachionus plicatilis]|uniref:Uncharacterized protein n=1 Tax=Brachionus plicatilis TaxID=10195 RepID=A0A3M7PA66_BRAPC|nr:hypothetical protein BpHYR1_013734 [Brachionus plicatilis]